MILPGPLEPMQAPGLHHLACWTQIGVVLTPISEGALGKDAGLLLRMILFGQQIAHMRLTHGLLPRDVVLHRAVLVIAHHVIYGSASTCIVLLQHHHHLSISPDTVGLVTRRDKYKH